MYALIKNSIAQKILSFFIIFSLVITPAIPAFAIWGIGDVTTDPAHTAGTAVNTGEQSANTATSLKEFALTMVQEVVKGIVGALLNKLTEATVNWINGGFKGSPQFIEKPEAFFKDIGNTQLKNLVDNIGYNAEKFPYGRSVAKTLVYGYLYDGASFEEQMQFDLDKVIGDDWKNFEYDFKVGGWEGYDAYVNNPANNSFGFLFAGVEEVGKRAKEEKAKIEKELDRGQGFLNQKVCTKTRTGPQVRQTVQQSSDAVSNDIENSSEGGGGYYNGSQYNDPDLPGYDPDAPTFEAPNDNGPTPESTIKEDDKADDGHYYDKNSTSEKLTNIDDEDCLEYKTLSPGTVVQTQLNRAMTSKFAQSELGQALGNAVSAIINALTTQLMNKGLSALSTAIYGGDSQQEDTWNFDGITLSGGLEQFASNEANGWASGPDAVYNLVELLITGPEVVTPDPNGGKPLVTNDPTKTVIALTEQELALNKEFIDIIMTLPKKIAELDICLPGPDMGWQERLRNKFQLATNSLNRKLNGTSNEKKQKRLTKALKYVENGAKSIAENIQISVLTNNIPDAVLMQDQIGRTRRWTLKAQEYYGKLLEKTTVVARLKSIKKQLESLGPVSQLDTLDLGGQAALALIIKQYRTLESEVSSEASIDRMLNEKLKIQEDIITIDKFLDKTNPNSCHGQRNNPVNQILFVYKVHDKRMELFETFSKIASGIALVMTGGLAATIPGVNGFIFDSLDGTNGGRLADLLGKTLPVGYKLGNAFGQGTIYDIAAETPPELSNIALINDVSTADMLATLIASPYDADLALQTTLNGMDENELRLVYSIVIGNNNNGYITDFENEQDLLNKAITFVSELPNTGGSVRVISSAETAFYCQQELDKVDLENVYKQYDVKISCGDFYRSDASDYAIEKDY